MVKNSYTFGNTTFEFNNLVIVKTVLLPEWERIGRLVQVRIGTGAFDSDRYLVRIKGGILKQFENALLQHFRGESQVEPEEIDNTYTLMNKYPERGFVITKPSEPKSNQHSFSMLVTE